jgi:multiple sugar transport system permease protein
MSLRMHPEAMGRQTEVAQAPAPPRPAVQRRSSLAGPVSGRRSSYIAGAVSIFVIAIMLFPIAMSVLSSLKPASEASQSPPHYLPTALSLENYFKVFHYQAGLGTYLFNSLAVAFLTIALCLALAVPAGYGLARFNIRAKEVLFLVLLSGLMIPYQALLTPLYLTFTKLVHTVLQLPFSVYLMRNSFEAVPRELEEAAVIDGCNSRQILRHIFLPSARPAIVTLILFAFIASWNEFIGALIFMNKETQFTVPIMLVGVRQGHFGAVDWGALQAGIIISIVPCMLIYVLLQKYYVSGFLSGALK